MYWHFSLVRIRSCFTNATRLVLKVSLTKLLVVIDSRLRLWFAILTTCFSELILNLKLVVLIAKVQFCCSDDAHGTRGQWLTKNRKMSDCLWVEVCERADDWPSAGLRLWHSAASCRTQGCWQTTNLPVPTSVNELARECHVSKSSAAHVFCIHSCYLWVVIDCVSRFSFLLCHNLIVSDITYSSVHCVGHYSDFPDHW